MKWVRSLLFKEEDIDTHVNTLSIRWDRIPNPMTEERNVRQIPCTAHRMTARNILGKMLLRRWWNKGIGSVGSLTNNGYVLEIYQDIRGLIG